MASVVIDARKCQAANKDFIPVGNIVEDIGQVPQGVDVKAGYRIFYGSHQGNGSFRGSLAVSDTGEIMGIGVVEPFSYKPFGRGLGKGYRAEMYVIESEVGFSVRKELLSWYEERLSEEMSFSHKMGVGKYIKSFSINFYYMREGCGK